MNYSCNTLRTVKHHLKIGGLVAFATESAYGIGCNPKNFKAIKRLLLFKKRPASKGLIVISDHLQDIGKIANISLFMSQNWHKHLIPHNNTRATSFIVNSRDMTLPILTGNRKTIAFRLIDNMKSISQLCSVMPMRLPIIATSANITGKIAFKNYKDIMTSFPRNKHLLLLKGYGKFFKKTSKIINLLDQSVVRD
jgi:L-threonylcarbamoyladenylate synthase